ncbi:replication/maintenance protein RepL [Cytobacillus oceanisediminis]|uniref:replication/maintenance protein RepL n=1 Tax=Cytobacillus oceanisediminis TaxID=665099 RepID=UPI00203DF624|nr:replication/maintenance protein RepL [Cytobacillus oceanisediminis]MCM3405926.1 replication/maintenance protein RepL [Cytobacillus oceanisediminis]
MARRVSERRNYWGAFVLDWFQYLQDNDFSGSDFKVLFFLCERMQVSDNSIYLRQNHIAAELNMDKGNVSKCIRKLSEKQFIVKKPNGFMINPHLFYVGKRDRGVREMLRNEFDDYLVELGKEPRFYLNEDEHRLEEIDGDSEDFTYMDGVF